MDGPRLFDIFEDPADLSDFLSSGFFSLPDNSECLTPQPQPEHQEKCQRVESGLSFWSDGAGKHDLSPILSGQEPRLNGNSQSNEVQKANETGLEQKFSFSQSQVETSATERISSTNERIVEKPMANEAVVVSTPSALAIDPAVSSSSNVSLLPPAKSVDTKKPTKPAFRIVSVDETNNKLNSSESLKSPTNASSTGSKIPVAQVNPTPRPVSRLETTTSEVSCGQGGSAAPAKPAEPPPAAVILAPQNGLNHQTFYGKIDGPNGPILLPISIVNGQMVLTAQVQTIQTPNGMISLCIPASGQFGGSTMPPIIMAPASVAPQSQPVETPKYFAAVPAVNNTPVTSEKVPISKAKKKPTASTTKKPNRVLKAKSVVETNSSSPQSPAILPRQNSVCVANFPQQPAIAPQPFVQILSSQQRQASPAQFQTVSSFVQRSYTQAPQPRPTAAAVCQTLLGSTGDGKFTVRLSAEEQNQLNRINTQIQSLQSAISKPSNYTDLMNSLEDQRRSILRKAVFQQLGPQMEPLQVAQLVSQPHYTGSKQPPLSIAQQFSESYSAFPSTHNRMGISSRSGGFKRITEHPVRTVAYALNSSPNVAQRLRNLLDLDKYGLSTPDTKNPFRDVPDVLARLLPYHLYSEPNVTKTFLEKVDADFHEVLDQFQVKQKWLRAKFQNVLWEDAKRSAPEGEFLLLQKLALQSEQEWLTEAKIKPEELVVPLEIKCEANAQQVSSNNILSPVVFSDTDGDSFSTGRTSSSLFGSPPLLERECISEAQPLTSISKESAVASLSPMISPIAEFPSVPTPTVAEQQLSAPVSPVTSIVPSDNFPSSPVNNPPPIPRLTLKIPRHAVKLESVGTGTKRKRKPNDDRLNNNSLEEEEKPGGIDGVHNETTGPIAEEEFPVFSPPASETNRCCEGSQDASAGVETCRKVPPLKLKLAGLSNGPEKILISKLLLKLPTPGCLSSGSESEKDSPSKLSFNTKKEDTSMGLETSDTEDTERLGGQVDFNKAMRVEPVKIKLFKCGGGKIKKRRRNHSRSEVENFQMVTTNIGDNKSESFTNLKNRQTERSRESDEEEMEL